MSSTNIAVFGATGNQGEWVLRALENQPNLHIVALTRNPDSPAASKLRARGFEVRKADLTMPAADLARIIADCPVVYGVTQPWAANNKVDEEGEKKQGKTLVAACKLAQVKHLIYSSIINEGRLKTPRKTLPHYLHKFTTIETAMAQDVPISVVAPAQFMDNWLFPFMKIEDGHITGFITPEAKVMYVSCRDIGKCVVRCVQLGPPTEKESDGLGKKARYVPAFTDFISGNELAAILVKIRDSKKKWTASAPPLFVLNLFSHEMALMRKWFEDYGLPPKSENPAATDQMKESREFLKGDYWSMEKWLVENGFDKKELAEPTSTLKKLAIGLSVATAVVAVVVGAVLLRGSSK